MVWGTCALFRVHVECTLWLSPASECNFTSEMSAAGGKGRVSDKVTCMASCLTEKDIPGASLNGRDPVVLTIPQLKRWLQCRNASTKGKKADLVAR